MWTVLGIIIATLIFLYYFIVKILMQGNNDYWPKQQVFLVLSSEVATLFELLTKKKTLIGMDQAYYEKISASKNRFGGIMELRRPVLMITDLDLIKQILVKDFDHFSDRRHIDIKNEPLFSEMVVMLEGQKWKNVRSVLSPTFTTGKMKRMFEHFNKCGKSFVQCVLDQEEKKVGDGFNLIVQDIVNRFSVDVIGATAFGMETNALKDPSSEFYQMTKRLSNITAWRFVKNVAYIVSPKFANAIGLRIFDKDMMDFFTGILHKALKNREAGGEKRNDFLQLLVEARKGELKEDAEELSQFEKEAQLKEGGGFGAGRKALFTDTLTMAQSFVFFTAGFDTVGSLVSMAAYLMAANQDIQEKVYEEVKSTMEENDGEIGYETVVNLDYMDKFISEILRRYPPANRLERRCVKEYKIPDSDVVLPKDSLVAISVQGIHMDPNLYPDPLKFDPERFTPENKASRHPYAYIPFGMGPRNCIGMRFALMESKVAIAYLAYYFLIEPSEKTPIPVIIDKNFGLNRPVAELELRFTPRNH